MQKVLANLLMTHAPLAALVGKQIDWDTLPQGTPQGTISMSVVSGITDYHMAGPSGLCFARIQFDCRDSTAAKARAIAEALKVRLSGYRGVYSGYKFMGCFEASQRTDFGKVDTATWFTDSRDYEITWGFAS